ncbi:hypothetical protein QEH52_15825 [Coraliomargarita sp. SDUM461003]|uniref:Pseudouridine synthase n=1 Tax=Thalassobacterium maritimum TaxID=3041265 RepID=A0ABU1AXV7_9BACT|nr:hypothetical protein [Coraliomargarita sp. SDUM461003]MDQ8208995.1 hypothetical protein [Coraliomargarita sp. SDUM461003]
MKKQPEIGGKKERTGAPKSRGPGGRGGQRGERRSNNNDFGSNWFDAALKK